MTEQANALALIQNVLDDTSLPRWQHDALSQAADAIAALTVTPQEAAKVLLADGYTPRLVIDAMDQARPSSCDKFDAALRAISEDSQ